MAGLPEERPPDDAEGRLIAAAFTLISERGWRRLSLVEAARRAGLPLAEASRLAPTRLCVLRRFGRRADAAALAGIVGEARPGELRDTLFDGLMRRIDALQAERAGVLALLRELPRDPALAAFLAAATLPFMGWLLEAAGVEATGLAGALRCKGLLAVWLATVRAWMRDDSEDLAATMAALDRALDRAGRLARWLPSSAVVAEAPPDDPGGEPFVPTV